MHRTSPRLAIAPAPGISLKLIALLALSILGAAIPAPVAAKEFAAGPHSIATDSLQIAAPTVGVWVTTEEGDASLTVSYTPNRADHYPGTDWPGLGGRSVFYAHDQPGWFANLVFANPGDPINVTRLDGTVFHYQVSSNQVTHDTSILRPGDHDQLVLVTCISWDNSDPKRIVVAELIDPLPPFTRPWSGGSDAVATAGATTDAYFAEGFTGNLREGWKGSNFQEFITVANVGPSQTLKVDYFLGDGQTVTRYYPMDGGHRITINVNDAVGTNQDVAAHLHGTSPFVAERPMYFNYNGITGGHDVMGATSLGKSFYFAEGYTGPGFNEYLTILNPQPTGAALSVDYFLRNDRLSPPPIWIPAHSRKTIHVNDVVGPNQEVSIHVGSDTPILVERPMYFNYGGKWTGGHDVVGASQAAPSLYLAEGFVSDNFDEFLTFTCDWIGTGAADPRATTTAQVAFHLENGAIIRADVSLQLGRRATLKVNDVLPNNTSASISIVSSNPNLGLVVERPMYFSYTGGVDGGHDAVAVPAAGLSTDMFFAEGYTGGSFKEYLTVLNPDPVNAAVATITYYRANGDPIVKPGRVFAPNSRTTILVNNPAEAGPNQDVSVEIAVSNGVKILAERPIYFLF